MAVMTARRGALTAALIAGLLCAARLLPMARFATPAPAAGLDQRTVRGAVHVHRPVGEEPTDRLLGAALDAGLDFIVTTTPGTLDSAAEGHEGYYTRPGRPGPPVMVLAAAEVSSDRGPLLILGGPPRARYPLTRRSAEWIAAAHAAGALVIALRPCRALLEPGAMPGPERPDPPDGVDGVEVLSVAADFAPGSWLLLAAGAVLAPVRPAAALAAIAAPHPADDGATAPDLFRRGGGAPIGGIGLTPGGAAGDPAPGTVLTAVTTRIVLDVPWERTPQAFARDREALLAALAAGRTVAVAGLWGEPGTVRFELEDEGRSVRARLEPATGAHWILRRDGEVVAEGWGTSMAAPVGAGRWRAEILRRRADLGLRGRGRLPWIVAGPWSPGGGA